MLNMIIAIAQSRGVRLKFHQKYSIYMFYRNIVFDN